MSLEHRKECGDLISVTELLAHFGITDFSMVPEALLEITRKYGNAVHSLFKYLALNIVMDMKTVDAPLLPYIDSWRDFIKKNDIELIDIAGVRQVEVRYKSKFGFCGKPDLPCRMKGKLTILDYKTPIKVPESCGIQLAGYEILCEEVFGERVKYKFAVHCDTPKMELIPFNKGNYKNDFLSIFNTFNLQKKFIPAKRFVELQKIYL